MSSTISNDIEHLASNSAETKEIEVTKKYVISGEILSVSDDATNNKLDATLPTHFENPHELETAYTNTKGDSSEGTKNIRQADNATNNVWKMDPSNILSSSEERNSTRDASSIESSTSEYLSTAGPGQQDKSNSSSDEETGSKGKHDPVVFVVDHSGQRKSIVVVDADGLQKVDEPIEDANEGKANNRKTAVGVEKLFIVHANTESTMSTSSSSSSGSYEQSESSTVGTSSTFADLETDGQVFETQFYESITSSPYDTIASKEIFGGEKYHSTKGPLPLSSSSSSSEEIVQSDNLFGDLSTSGFVILDSVTDRSSAASQQSFDAQFYGTEGPNRLVYDGKYYSSEQIEGSSSPYEFSLFSRLSTALSEGTSEPTMDISSGDVESEDELPNPFENPEFPRIPDDLSLHGMMDDDHDVISNSKQQSMKEQQTDRPSAERILLDVLPLRSNGSIENDSVEASSSSMAPEQWLKSTDDDSNNDTASDEKLNTSTTSPSPDSLSSTTSSDSSSSSSSSTRISSYGDSYEDYTPSSNSYENLSADSSKPQYIEETPLNQFFMDAAKDLLRFQNKMFVA